MVSNNILRIMQNIGSKISGTFNEKVRCNVPLMKDMLFGIDIDVWDSPLQILYHSVLAEESYRSFYKLYKLN